MGIKPTELNTVSVYNKRNMLAFSILTLYKQKVRRSSGLSKVIPQVRRKPRHQSNTFSGLHYLPCLAPLSNPQQPDLT